MPAYPAHPGRRQHKVSATVHCSIVYFKRLRALFVYVFLRVLTIFYSPFSIHHFLFTTFYSRSVARSQVLRGRLPRPPLPRDHAQEEGDEGAAVRAGVAHDVRVHGDYSAGWRGQQCRRRGTARQSRSHACEQQQRRDADGHGGLRAVPESESVDALLLLAG